MADLNHSSLRRGRSADDTAPQQKHYSSVSASIGPQGQNKKPFVPKPFGPMNTHTAKNIPDTLYTTQVRLRKVGDILTFIGSDPHGVPKSAEEFQKAIENLSFRNPLVLTYSSKSEAEYFTSKHGENGKVYSISTKGLKPGTVFENPLNDGQFVFLHHVPYNHIDANNEQKLTATSKPKQPILVEDSEDEHDSGDDYLSDSAPCHHCGRPPLSKKRKVTFAEDTITGKRSHETNIQDAPSRKRTASVDEDELSIPKKKRKVQTAVPSKGAAAAKKSEPDNSKKVEKTQNAPTNKTTLSTKNSEPNNTKKLEKAQTTSINKTTSSAKDSESNDSKKRKIAQTSESAAVEEDSQPDKTKKRKITNTDESAAAAEESEPDNSKKRKTAKTAPKARQVKAKVPIAAEPITEAQLVTEAKPESIITSEPAKSSRAARAERLSEKRGTSTSKPAKAASFTENVRTTRAITKAAVKKQDPATTEKKQAAVIAKTFDRSKNGRFKSAANNTTGTAETPMQSQVSQDSDTKMPSNKPETSSGIQTQFPSSGGSEKTASEKVPAKKGPSKKHSSGKSLPEIILSEETATGEILSKKILPKKKAISKKITSNKTTSDMAASYLESFTDDHVYSITESTTFAAATGCMITPEEKHSTINGALTTPKIDANTTFNNSTTLLSSPPLHSIAQPSSKMNQETDIQKRKAEGMLPIYAGIILF